jgi:hypothetical protein
MKRSGRNMPLTGSKNCSMVRTSIRPFLRSAAVDVLRQLVVLGRVGAVPVVEGDVEAVEVRLRAGGDAGDELLRRLARPSRRRS